jgi:diguanylate cyclase
MPLTAGLERPARAIADAIGVLLGLCVLALALVDVGLLGGGGLSGHLTAWVYSGVELGVAGLVIARAVLVGEQRRPWLLLGTGFAFLATGGVYYALALESKGSVPIPSLSDGGYLMFYPFAFAMIVSLIGGRAGEARDNGWLDGAIGGLTLAAVGSALMLEPVIHHSTDGTPVSVATSLAYPLGDLVLVVFVFGVFVLSGWRPGRTWLLIALGFALMAIGDSVYLFRVAEDSYRAGTILDALWPAGLLMLAYAAWSEPRRGERPELRSGVEMMLVPCLFAAVALFLLIRADFVHLGVIPECLAGAALLVAGVRFAVSFNDVRRLSDIRERQARTDDLTGLANRRHFYERLNETIAHCRRQGTEFALLTIDLDHFKELNDTLGHHAGDLLLQQIGPRLQVVIDADAIGRLGGDEFGVILRDVSSAASTAEQLQRALRRPFEMEGLTVSVHASIGIAVFPDDAGSASGMLRRADIALYHAKDERSRYAFYAPSTDHNSRERLGLVADLKGAIEQGGLIVHYQPQVDLRTNTVSGVEALVRWQHPRRGLLGADQFVGIAEQTGVMRELTASVLEQALAQQRAWLDEGRELTLAVNVSATNLVDSAFLADLRRRLERWRTPPGMLRLEITESVLISEGSRVHEVIDSLGDLGVNLSLDDFGTGYSPLSYLRELPVTEIKIDRSFVEAMMNDRDTSTIVSSVIGLAHRLGIEVVAEGIETAGQLEMLRSFDCPFAQGYLFSKPLPAQVAGRWLKEDAHQHIAEEVLAAGTLRPLSAIELRSRMARPISRALVWQGPLPPG